MRTVVIEDEPLARKELIKMLKQVSSSIEIIKELISVEESILWFQENNEFDLVISDIQLIDGHSFEIYQTVNLKKPVVFTTAFDDYAVKAFELNSIDYLLKPFSLSALEKAINKYREYSESQQLVNLNALKELVGQVNPTPTCKFKKRFISKVGDQYKLIKVVDIAYFEADGNIVYGVMNNKKRYFLEYSLDDIQSLLNPEDFFRVSRKFIIAQTSINGIHKYFNSRLKLEIQPKPDEMVLVSRSRLTNFLDWIDQ